MDKSSFRFIEIARKLGKSPKDLLLACGVTTEQMKAWGKTWTPDEATQKAIVSAINKDIAEDLQVKVFDIFGDMANAEKASAPKSPEAKKEPDKKKDRATARTKNPTENTNTDEPGKKDAPKASFAEDATPAPTPVTIQDPEKEAEIDKTPVAEKPAKKRTPKKTVASAISFESVANDIRNCADNLNRAFEAYKTSLPKYTEKQQELINIIIDLKEKDLELLIATAKRLR